MQKTDNESKRIFIPKPHQLLVSQKTSTTNLSSVSYIHCPYAVAEPFEIKTFSGIILPLHIIAFEKKIKNKQ